MLIFFPLPLRQIGRQNEATKGKEGKGIDIGENNRSTAINNAERSQIFDKFESHFADDVSAWRQIT
jgi:hypothetical protein